MPEELIGMLLDAQLAELADGGLRPLVRVTPFQGLLLVGDLHNEDSSHVAPDAVENPHGPTEVLSRLIPRQPVARSLDIGTGPGFHALRLAGHADTVVGTDMSPRAVDFARFNACLNGITNVRFARTDVSDGLENNGPYDLIVSNPPYLVSPEIAVIYRDGAGSGHIGTRVLTEAPSLLAPNGMVVCLTSWGVTDTTDPAGPIRAIANSVGCHALTLLYARRAPLDNALRWNTHCSGPMNSDESRRHGSTSTRNIESASWPTASSSSRRLVTNARGSRRSTSVSQGRCLIKGSSATSWQPKDGATAGTPLSGCELIRTTRSRRAARSTARKRVTRDQSISSTRGIRFTVECGPRLLERITASEIPSVAEPGAGVIETMAQRLYELGLATDGDADG